MIKYFLTTIITITCILLQAQTRIENVSFKQAGNNIVVNYDLYCNSSFDAQLFYSTNNGVSWHGPLSNITGDVSNVKQGQGKSITWNVLKDQNWLISDNIKFKVAEESNQGIFTDTRDNQTYKWVKIGKQKWMAENLNYKTTESYCYDDIESNCQKYGRLYTWKVAKNACPDGWHLPTDNEWKQLEKQLGMSQTDADDTGWRGTDEGKELKATNGWKSNGNGTDSYGFLALPAGYRNCNGTFLNLSYVAYFWSATESNSSRAWIRYLYYDNSDMFRYYRNKDYGFSVRCLKDN